MRATLNRVLLKPAPEGTGGDGSGPRVRLAGRIMLRRDGGKVNFLELRDWTDRIQVFVGKNQVGIGVWNPANGGLAVTHGNDFNAAFLEREGDHFLDVCVVVCDQNPGHCIPLAAHPNATRLPLHTPYCSTPK